jgi:putative membrane protein
MITWELEPGVVVSLLLPAALYAAGQRKHVALAPVRKFLFWSGLFSLAVALLSSLHPLGEELFSAHMLQHEILMLISAPLLVLSRPLVTFLWALPLEWRQNLGRWSKKQAIARSWSFLTAAFTAWLIHAVAIWAWHAPYLFQLTLRSELAHTAQHLSFFLTALLFWWAVFYARGRKAYGAAFLSVFTTAIHTGILGALLTFSPRVWYPAYGNSMRGRSATRSGGHSAIRLRLLPYHSRHLGSCRSRWPAFNRHREPPLYRGCIDKHARQPHAMAGRPQSG